MKKKIITIFGGSGFIGRYIVKELAKTGCQLRIAVRNPDRADFLKPYGYVGQITPLRVNIKDPDSLHHAIKGSNTVINLIGILYEQGPQKFKTIHIETAKNIALLSARHGVQQLIHMSALNASAKSPSLYASSKGKGEKEVLKHFPNAIILRPSAVFGPEDHFLNLFAQLARYSMVLPLIGGGHARVQPVYVGDVAKAIKKLVQYPHDSNPYSGQVIELAGPKIYRWKELWEYVLSVTGRKRLLLPIPSLCARWGAYFLKILPHPILTPDQVTLLTQDNILSGKHPTLTNLDIAPTSLESLAPSYLQRYKYYE